MVIHIYLLKSVYHLKQNLMHILIKQIEIIKVDLSHRYEHFCENG